jgi:hypothetical protein
MATQSNASAIAALDVKTALVDVGTTNASARITIYSGAVPASPDASLASAVLLATVVMDPTAFAAAVDADPHAEATAAAITGAAAVATGNPSFFRITNRNNLAVHQGTAGGPASGMELIFPADTITSGVTVNITSLIMREREF